MIAWLPSIYGWFAPFTVVFALVYIPEIFPPRGAGSPRPPAPMWVWAVAAVLLGCCVIACWSAIVRGKVVDKIVGGVAGVVTLLMIILCVLAAFE